MHIRIRSLGNQHLHIYSNQTNPSQQTVLYLSMWMSVQCKRAYLQNVVASFVYANILWFMHFRIYRVLACDLWMDNGINGDRCNGKMSLEICIKHSVGVLDNFIFFSCCIVLRGFVEMINTVNSSPVYLPLLWNAQEINAIWSVCIFEKRKTKPSHFPPKWYTIQINFHYFFFLLRWFTLHVFRKPFSLNHNLNLMTKLVFYLWFSFWFYSTIMSEALENVAYNNFFCCVFIHNLYENKLTFSMTGPAINFTWFGFYFGYWCWILKFQFGHTKELYVFHRKMTEYKAET